jgi:hypothetical protein
MMKAYAAKIQKIKKYFEYLYHSLCLFFLLSGVLTFIFDEASWINYFIIFSGLSILSFTWHVARALGFAQK